MRALPALRPLQLVPGPKTTANSFPTLEALMGRKHNPRQWHLVLVLQEKCLKCLLTRWGLGCQGTGAGEQRESPTLGRSSLVTSPSIKPQGPPRYPQVEAKHLSVANKALWALAQPALLPLPSWVTLKVLHCLQYILSSFLPQGLCTSCPPA